MLSSHYPETPQSPFRRVPTRSHPARILAGLIGIAALTATLALAQQQQSTPPAQSAAPASQPHPSAASLPDASHAVQTGQPQSKQEKIDAANALRRKQIADEAAKLLALATELKNEVNKTDKDTLSLQVIRKAESVEKVAKGVKDKMKQTMGAS